MGRNVEMKRDAIEFKKDEMKVSSHLVIALLYDQGRFHLDELSAISYCVQATPVS